MVRYPKYCVAGLHYNHTMIGFYTIYNLLCKETYRGKQAGDLKLQLVHQVYLEDNLSDLCWVNNLLLQFREMRNMQVAVECH